MPKKPTHPTRIVTTSGAKPVAEVAAALKKAGFEVGEVMHEIGIISGRAAKSSVGALRKTAGVADIAPDSAVSVGPPDAPIS